MVSLRVKQQAPASYHISLDNMLPLRILLVESWQPFRRMHSGMLAPALPTFMH